MMPNFEIDLAACRGRQRRLLEVMRAENVELFVATSREAINWLTGYAAGPMFSPVAALAADGKLLLVAPGRKPLVGVAADEVLGYEAQWHSTLRNDQRAASSQVLLDAVNGALKTKPRRVGCEFSSFGPWLAGPLGAENNHGAVDLEPALYYLRRRKDADELRLMEQAIAATAAAYAKGREIIAPGVNEIDVYNQLYAAGVGVLGEPPTYYGQDFQCNARGGPPRNRICQAGELYILDLGFGFRGYFSDNARTIAVDKRPTDAQLRAWEQIQKVFQMIESSVRPGVRAKDIFFHAQSILDEVKPWTFDHHLGHGVGLFPHEAPHLNPNWDDTFEVGDLFTAEPGLYHEELRHGMRLEQNYLVTEQGVRLLTEFSLEL